MLRRLERICLLALLGFGVFAAPLHAQAPSGGIETATQDRLDDAGWWPTKGEAARSSYVGSESCIRCHGDEARLQPHTAMAQAGRRADEADLLRRYTSLLFVREPYTYRIATHGASSDYSVTDGQQTVAAPISWAFGVGEYGQTYLYLKDQVWYESEVSLYPKPGVLDMTTGHPAVLHASLDEALGHSLNAEETRHCFACHTTMSTTAHRFDPEGAVGGIACEACHGPGREHVAKMAAGTKSDEDVAITNPGRMSPVDSVDFCGACHRTWADVAFTRASGLGLAVVRFQPYRLEKSRCWGTSGDQRITCIACHNPHEPLNRDASSYDPQCLACHVVRNDLHPQPQKQGAACPVSADKCVTCHMPKYALKDMHGEFTDHMIRVVRKGEKFPE